MKGIVFTIQIFFYCSHPPTLASGVQRTLELACKKVDKNPVLADGRIRNFGLRTQGHEGCTQTTEYCGDPILQKILCTSGL